MKKIDWARATDLEKVNAIAVFVMRWPRNEDSEATPPVLFGWFDDEQRRQMADEYNPRGVFNPLKLAESTLEIIAKLERERILVTISNRFEPGPQKWEVIAQQPALASPGDGTGIYGYGATFGEALCKAALRIKGIEVDE